MELLKKKKKDNIIKKKIIEEKLDFKEFWNKKFGDIKKFDEEIERESTLEFIV